MAISVAWRIGMPGARAGGLSASATCYGGKLALGDEFSTRGKASNVALLPTQAADRAVVHAERSSDRAARIALGHALAGLGLLVIGELGLTTHMLASGLSSLPAALSASQDAIALILGQGTQEGQQAPVDWLREIQVAPIEHLDECPSAVHTIDDRNAIGH